MCRTTNEPTTRALYSVKRALFYTKRALYFVKRAPSPSNKSSSSLRMYIRLCVCRMSNEPGILPKEPSILSKEPYFTPKEPYILSKEPHLPSIRALRVGACVCSYVHIIFQKSPIFHQKSPYILSQKPYILSKEPYVPPKEPYVLLKELNLPPTRALQVGACTCGCTYTICQKSRTYCQKSPIFHLTALHFVKRALSCNERALRGRMYMRLSVCHLSKESCIL